MASVHYIKQKSAIFNNVKKSDYIELQIKESKTNYQIGDTVIIEEVNDKEKHTGAWCAKTINTKFTGIMRGLQKDHLLLGLSNLKI
jgi:hypothetical protein